MIQITTLQHTSAATLFTAFSEAFSDYAYQWTAPELQHMLQRRGYNPALSLGAFDGERLVSFILNADGLYQGKATAYDTGTGTVPGYRGRKLSAGLFRNSIPMLEKAGMQQYLLEVLQDNDTAIGIYRRSGFNVSRSFHYFSAMQADTDASHKRLPEGYDIRPAAIATDHMEAMWDFVPAWQNSFASIDRCPDHFICLGAWQGDTLAGYGILEPHSGDLTQVAVHPEHRRRGIGTVLLQQLLLQNRNPKIRIINTHTQCTAITAFAERSRIVHAGSQYEMMLDMS